MIIYVVYFVGALFTGIYGMWNVYVMSIMFLYAPSSPESGVDGTGKITHLND